MRCVSTADHVPFKLFVGQRSCRGSSHGLAKNVDRSGGFEAVWGRTGQSAAWPRVGFLASPFLVHPNSLPRTTVAGSKELPFPTTPSIPPALGKTYEWERPERNMGGNQRRMRQGNV